MLLTTVSCGESTEVLTREPGRMEGSVVLEGHEVPCQEGVPSGQLVFELYAWASPGAPQLLDSLGRGPEQVRVLPASSVFGGSDCGGEADTIHSGSFAVEEVGPAVGTTDPREYLVRVIYDRDEDYRAEPAVFRTPTRGDLIGGVVEALPSEETSWTWTPVRFEPPVDHPEGQLIGDITVKLGLQVDLEPPASELIIERNLSSDATIPITTDTAAREQVLAEHTGSRLRLLTDDALELLSSAGLPLAREPEAMAWLVSEPLEPGPLHPVLGDQGVPWLTPLVSFERRRTAAEEQAGIPRVRIVATVRPTEALIKQVFRPSIQVVVPPIAHVVLTDDPECAVPLIPGGNEIGTYERLPVDCQELPTGPYDLRILHGVAGATVLDGVPEVISDIGRDWADGAFAAQAWTLPNELPLEGQDRGLWVIDGDPSSEPDPTRLTYGHGQEQCEQAIDAAMMMPREIQWQPVTPECCEPIQHLCGLPLCDAAPGPDDGTVVRSLTELDEDGSPACVPFAMPASCCGA